MTMKKEFKRELNTRKDKFRQEVQDSQKTAYERRNVIMQESIQVIDHILKLHETDIKQLLINKLVTSEGKRLVLSVELVEFGVYQLELTLESQKIMLTNNRQDLDKLERLKGILGTHGLKKMLNGAFTKLLRDIGLRTVTDRWSKNSLLTIYVFKGRMLFNKLFADVLLAIVQIAVIWGILWLITHFFYWITPVDYTFYLERNYSFKEFYLNNYSSLVINSSLENVAFSVLSLLITSVFKYRRTNFSVIRVIIAMIITESLIVLGIM